MTTTVELTNGVDTIEFRPDPEGSGFVYDNETLTKWYELTEVEAKVNKRPNAHGTYGLGELFTKESRPIIKGQYFGVDAVDALEARDRLSGMFNNGRPVLMTVIDERGPQSRTAWVVEFTAPFLYDFSHFELDIALIAPDPRRYGPTVSTSDGMPAGSSGLVWDLGTAPSGLYLDWGTEGVLGQVAYTNTGQATTLPRIEVGGNGSFAIGFRVTEIETGRELTIMRDTNLGEVIVLNSRTQRATISNGGGDITGDMTQRQWFAIPPRATRRYQITPLGAVTGTPTITLYAAPANL